MLCPQMPHAYQMELPDVSLIPHRISSSPDWRPASLFVPAFQCLGKSAGPGPNRIIMSPCELRHWRKPRCPALRSPDSAHLPTANKLDARGTIAVKLVHNTMGPLLHYYLKKQ
jgi:hypothetical protein